MLTPLKADHPPLLPAGFAVLTLGELAAIAIAPFPTSMRRAPLFEALEVFHELLAKSGLVGELWIDGSFVTSKDEPDDIDAVFVFDPAAANALTEPERTYVKHLLDPRLAWERFRLHLFSVSADARDDKAYWRGLFCFQRDEKTPKGVALVKVNPRDRIEEPRQLARAEDINCTGPVAARSDATQQRAD